MAPPLRVAANVTDDNPPTIIARRSIRKVTKDSALSGAVSGATKRKGTPKMNKLIL